MITHTNQFGATASQWAGEIMVLLFFVFFVLCACAVLASYPMVYRMVQYDTPPLDSGLFNS
jgi:hypothetical protein